MILAWEKAVELLSFNLSNRYLMSPGKLVNLIDRLMLCALCDIDTVDLGAAPERLDHRIASIDLTHNNASNGVTKVFFQ